MNVHPKAPADPSIIDLIAPEAIRTYCTIVFGYLDGFVAVRLLSEPGTPQQSPKQFYLRPAELAGRLADEASRAAHEQRAVFVVPATVARPGSAKASDIDQTGVILVDLDHGDLAAKRVHLVNCLGAPSLEVGSGGLTAEGQQKLHLYWRLTEAATGSDLELVAHARQQLAAKIGGDPSFQSLHQPIRVAGTVHGKNGHKAPVRILASRDVEFDLRELAAVVDEMPALPGSDAAGAADGTRGAGPSARELATRRIREGGLDGITRHDALSRVIGHWLRTARQGRCSLAEAWTAVLDHNAACIDPPWDADRLRREFEALQRVDAEKHGLLAPAPGASENAERDHPTPPDFSDDAVAAEFVAREGGHWRHVAAWGTWLHWNGCVWTRDATGLVRERMRQVCRFVAARAESRDARRISSEKTITAALKLAATDPCIARGPDNWDQQRSLLNTPAGIVDLTTGEIRAHDPELCMTLITCASPGSGCPSWLTFLDQVTDGDAALQGYLQRLAGYCLTGSTREQVFAFLHGHGANGKSVFVGAIVRILGGYAATATLDTFTSSRTQRHLTELAGLRAARLVLVPETECGQGWSEARLKLVTGGEKIRANFMHRDHFEYQPAFKLIVTGNHRPTFGNVGEAIRRRLHLVPFGVTIPENERDPRLGDKLFRERDGILGWMIDGCAAWQKGGLAPPLAMRQAAGEYLADEDIVGQWLGDCCTVRSDAREQSALLYTSWRSWAEQRGFHPGSQKSLGETLRARGFHDHRVKGNRGWSGLAVHHAASAEGIKP